MKQNPNFMTRFSFLFLILFIFFSKTAFSQNNIPNYGDLISTFQTAIKARNLNDMKSSSDKLVKYYTDDYAGYALSALFYLCKGQNKEAKQQVETMLQLNPIDAGAYGIKALLEFVLGKKQEAELYLQYAFQIANYNEFKLELRDDTSTVQEMTSRNDFEEYKLLINDVFNQNPQNIVRASTLLNCFTQAYQGKTCDNFEKEIGEFQNLKPINPIIPLMSKFAKAVLKYSNYENEDAKNLFKSFIVESKPLEHKLRFFRGSALSYLAGISFYNYDYRTALINSKKSLTELSKLNIETQLQAFVLNNKCNYEIDLNLKEDNLQTSYNLLAIANILNSDYYKAYANNNIGQYYLESVIPGDRAKAAKYLYEALRHATNSKNYDLENSIRSNYMIVLWQQGKKSEAINNFNTLFENYMANKDYDSAELAANNMGFMHYIENNYHDAANYFKKAIDLTENVKKHLSPKQKLTLMNSRTSSYSGLIMSYQKTGNTKALFEAQDINRSSFLRNRLNANSKGAKLEDAQQLLGENDVLLYYTLAGPGELIINVITNNNAQIIHSYPIDDWIRMKKRWIDRTKKIPSSYNSFMSGYTNDIVDGNFIRYSTKEQSFTASDFKQQVEWTRQLLESDAPNLIEVRNAFLQHWYNFTLLPIQNLINSKTNIIISASNELNYLPFEAFIDGTGKYFIENHNVRYIPSVSVWKTLKNRNYSSNKKPALAMGGALFQPSGNVKGTARGIDDFFAISESINEKINQGDYNFKSELQKMGFGGAQYLKGTLDEVNFVGLLDPNIKVVTGLDMTESYLKQLDKTGELKNYKIIMLSSHGFTIDIIPEFSGVMMSQPNNGDGNEDTFLLAPEIARLNLEADLVVLSACDTALGALVGGEGINGLNSAFLIAGANNTLLSLWPVDDSGTALTMKNLFKMIIIDGIDSFTSINQIKRAMATGNAGERLKAPKYWAPFLLNGK